MAMIPLDPKKIAEVKSHSRERGVYLREWRAFLDGNEAGVQVDLSNGTFESKNVTTVQMGFRNAIDKLPESDRELVRVVRDEDNVYLLRNDG